MKKGFITTCMLVILFVLLSSRQCTNHPVRTEPDNTGIEYACTPCGSGCDTAVYTKAGTCSHCNMVLVDKSSIVHKNIQADKMCSLDENNIVFLDVRTPAEFNGTAEQKFGAIKNAINIPVQELEKRVNELAQYKDKEIIVYCSHSHRSPRASYMLTQTGFKKITNMLGGMSVWKDRVKEKDCNEKLYRSQ